MFRIGSLLGSMLTIMSPPVHSTSSGTFLMSEKDQRFFQEIRETERSFRSLVGHRRQLVYTDDAGAWLHIDMRMRNGYLSTRVKSRLQVLETILENRARRRPYP